MIEFSFGIEIIWFLLIHSIAVTIFHGYWGLIHFDSRFRAIAIARSSDDESYYGVWKPRLDRFQDVHNKFNKSVKMIVLLNYINGIKLYREALKEQMALNKEVEA